MNNNKDPLQDLINIEQDARKFGFEWPDVDMIIAQAISECDEIQAAIADGESQERVQEEIGDLLHTAISLCVFAGFDVNQTLNKVTKKFNARMQGMKQIAQQRGLESLHGKDMQYMLDMWREVKSTTY